MSIFRLLRRLFVAVLVLATLFVFGFYGWVNQPVDIRTAEVDFRIPQGSSVRAAIKAINDAGIPLQDEMARLLIKFLGAENSLKAGSYTIKQGQTHYELIQKMKNGDVSLVELRFPEGWTFKQWRQYLDQQSDIEHQLGQLTDEQVLKKLNIPHHHPEGLFFPDTYKVDKFSSDLELLSRAYKLGQEKLQSAWQGRVEGLPYRNAYEALIMASIVEKETGKPEDRQKVAAVFVNRLKIGMRLQTDPTVIYGLGNRFDGNLRKMDLLTDTPYNSYTRAGMPPTPIAMPGMASIQAALNPANVDALYFVARGDGTSQFSRTLDEHNAAVRQYQLKR